MIRTSDAYVGRSVLGWSGLAAVAAAGLAALTTAVEAAETGLGPALRDGLLAAPALVVGLAPLIVAMGAALAAARAASRGERVALELVGLGPWRTARAAAVAGALVGLLAWGLADQVVPRAEAVRGRPAAGWVWHEGLAVRQADGLAVRARDGQVEAPTRLSAAELEDPALARSASLQRPRLASGEALAGSTLLPAQVERLGRRLRALACAALAFAVWLPLARRPAPWLGRALALGLAYQLIDGVLQSASARGQLPLAVGTGGALVALICALALAYALSSSRST